MTWLPDGDEISDREKSLIQSPKLMLTFVWNPHGFQIVDAMPMLQWCNASVQSVDSLPEHRFHFGIFPGKVPVRQCAHNNDALQCITFHS
jgi:hypothetical protein